MTKQINGDKLFVIDHHPAIPPSDQLKKWEDQWFDEEEHPDVLLIQAFQAGADLELEACCEWLRQKCGRWATSMSLRAARRPKPPSLKEQSLALIDLIQGNKTAWELPDLDIVRRALEQIDD